MRLCRKVVWFSHEEELCRCFWLINNTMLMGGNIHIKPRPEKKLRLKSISKSSHKGNTWHWHGKYLKLQLWFSHFKPKYIIPWLKRWLIDLKCCATSCVSFGHHLSAKNKMNFRSCEHLNSTQGSTKNRQYIQLKSEVYITFRLE